MAVNEQVVLQSTCLRYFRSQSGSCTLIRTISHPPVSQEPVGRKGNRRQRYERLETGLNSKLSVCVVLLLWFWAGWDIAEYKFEISKTRPFVSFVTPK